MVFELLGDAAVTVTAPVALEDLFDEAAQMNVFPLRGGGLRSMIEAAARQLQSQADLPDAGTGLRLEA
jgi:hypothetical protein